MKYALMLLFTSVVASLTSCGGKSAASNERNSKKTPVPNVVITVNTLKIKRSPFKYFIECSGKIKPEKQQILLANASGLLTRKNVKNGQLVSYGQLILQTDTRNLLMRIAKLKESLYNSKLNFESDFLSQENILKYKSKNIRDSVVRKLRAGSGLSSMEIEMEELTLDLENSSLKAPFSGQLVNVKINDSGYIKSGDEVCTIFTPKSLFLDAKVLETDLNFIRVGQSAEVLPVAGGKKFRAVVSEINPIVDETGLIGLKLKIIDPKGLIPGMNATASIISPSANVLAVPKSAVVNHEGKYVVFTSENGLALWHYVRLGRDNGQEVEILDGITENDNIITTDNLQLTHNTPIKERND